MQILYGVIEVVLHADGQRGSHGETNKQRLIANVSKGE
jgi:hypothetical protein